LGLTFSQAYGDDVDSLENWQRLCSTVEIPVSDSLEECQFVRLFSALSLCLELTLHSPQAIEDAHINLIDLVDVKTTGAPVHRFATEAQLSAYTMRTGKIFPRDLAYKGQLLRHLLRRIFHPPAENLMRRGGHWVERNPEGV
jgi:hypothetical protein